ncbi:TPA: MFS transporter [Escherichia coli]|nr:MFS transporter [Escherichia coli]
MKSEVLSVKEKIGYGMGDAASHIIFDNVMLYMMFFYTDISGIPAGFVGTMFLVARALDAISDPCMGLLADRTRSRWGKFRPWVLFGALPFGIVCVLAYSTPDLSMNGKMIYAAINYTLLTLLYTIVNIPYCALGGVITNDPTQRVSLQSWRFVLATAGGMLSTVLMMPLVNLIGGDNKPLGFQGGIAVLSVVAFMMLAFCFFTTKERVEAPPTTTSMRDEQGFGVGGEQAGAVLMTAEYSEPKHRGLFSSWVQIGAPVGFLLPMALFALLNITLSPEAMMDYGWRIPFLLSLLLVIVGLFIRLKIDESPVFAQIRKTKAEESQPLVEVIRSYPSIVVKEVCAKLIEVCTFSMFTVIVLAYGKANNLDSNILMETMIVAVAFEVVAIPLMGALCDKIGRKPVSIMGTIIQIVTIIPFFLSINQDNKSR